MDEEELVDGIDELGVLLYGHDKNAYWYGSQLSIEETRARALPERDGSAGDLGGAGRHGLGAGKSRAGIVEADEMDYRRCLEVQMPYLGPVKGLLSPTGRRSPTGPSLFPEDIDTADPWQFRNVLVR
jgi:homospermidine synthase